jgi:DNA repair exonuclease SbcCD nuclease subunit
MKLALIADTHAGARNDNPFFNEFFLKFFEDTFIPHIIQNDIKTVIHLGDVFDRRKYINFQTLRDWRVRVFDRLEALGVELHIIIGNHDTYWKTTNEINSVTELIRSYKNIKIYENPTTVEFDETPILFVPWINSTNQEQTLNAIQTTKARLVCGHLEIIGFEHFRGHTNTDKGWDRKVFDKFEMVFSGHFHFKSQQDNIWYLGSPYQMVWNDYEDERGFHIFDTRSRDLDFIPNDKHIFDKIFYDDTGETYETLMGVDLTVYAGKSVKIIVEKKNDPHLFDQFLEELYKVHPIDVSVIEMELVGTIEEGSIDEGKDTLSILVDYVESLSLDPKLKPLLIERLREIYIDASTLERDDV